MGPLELAEVGPLSAASPSPLLLLLLLLLEDPLPLLEDDALVVAEEARDVDAEATPSGDRTVVGGFSGRERRVGSTRSNSAVDDAVATLRSGFDAIRAPPPLTLKSGDVAFAFEMSWIERITAAPSELVSSCIAVDEGEDSAAGGREELEADEGERKKGPRCGICLAGAATLGTERARAESRPVMSDPSAAPRGSSMPCRAPVTAATFNGAGAGLAEAATAAAAEETFTAGSESTDDARDDEVEVEEDNRVRRRAAAARGLEEPAIPPAPRVFATAVAVAATFANLCAPRPLSCSVPRMNGFLVAHCPLPSTIPDKFDALPCPSSRLFHRHGTWRTAPPCRAMASSCERAERRSEGWTAPSAAEAR